MKNLHIKLAVLLTFTGALSACGGGGGENSTNDTGSNIATATPIFTGAYNGDGLNLSNNADNSCAMVPQTEGGQVQWGKDVLLVSSQNVGYRVCGYRLWTGPISGTVSYNTKALTTPASGAGQISLDYYLQAGAPKAQTSVFNGNVVTVSGTDFTASALDFKNSDNSTFKFNRVVSPVTKTITNNYSTFAGSYTQVDWSLLGTTNVSTTDTLTVSSSGSVTGATQMGQLSGTITKFDAKYGVHDISMTVTPSSGTAYTMTGVIGPGPTTSGSADDFSNVTLALTGGGKSYAAVFKMK